ncbi:MAG: hypothetical protein ABFC96_11210 [Thermoguttaceae bacterium]
MRLTVTGDAVDVAVFPAGNAVGAAEGADGMVVGVGIPPGDIPFGTVAGGVKVDGAVPGDAAG